MRLYGLALLTGAAALSACSSGDKKPIDSTNSTPVVANPPAANASGAATTTTPSSGAVAKVPATGATHNVNMVGDDKGYRFEPANLTIKSGDAVKFIMVTGGPHNVAFDPATVPPDSKAQLDANMDQKMSELSSPLLMNPGESYVISFGGVKPGVYPFHCTPHLAMGMKGVLTVQ